jgi:DnaK suppressor protein
MKTPTGRQRIKERPEDRWQSLLQSEHDLLRQRLSLHRLGENLLAGGTAEEDAAVLLHEEYISEAAQRREVARLREVEEALQRLSRGAYGRCEECGEEIAAKRLQAIPWARCCVSCQEQLARDPSLDEHAVLS